MKRIILAFAACLSFAGMAAAQDFTISAPNSLSATTCSAVNNCALSPSEDHIIQVNIPCAGAWNFSLCGSSYNTKMFLTTANCGGTTLASNDDFCSQQSEFTVTLAVGIYYLAIEGSGASDCGVYTLSITDDEAPVISNCQADISVNNDAGDCGAVINYSTPTATDNCVLSSFTGTHSSGSLFPVGTTTVTYTATDGGGNVSTCSFDITVSDIELPVITNCPSTIVSSNATGQCGANVSWAVPVASDNCGINSFTSTHSPGAFFTIGTTTVIYTATDNSGNSITCSFTVSVNDTEDPTLTCPSTITVNNSAGQCGAVVTYSVTGADNCPGSVTTLTSGLASGSFFPVGTTLVSYLVTDASSNTATCSFSVIVEDNEAPVFNCPDDLLICGNNSVVTFPIPSFTENCGGGAAVQISGPASGSTLAVGTYTVTFRASDGSGNFSDCSYDIVVGYNPVADYGYSTSCAGDLIFFTEFSTIQSGTIDMYSWNMGDGSGPITIRNPVYQFPNTGTYSVALTVTSDMGCVNTHTETVIITDVPSASFTVSPQCATLQTVFNNTSTIITGDLDYEWNFGDGTTGLGDDPVHVYNNPGTYTVILTVTSIDGCVDDFSSTVNILANPLANFTATSLNCFGDASGAFDITGYGSLAPYQYSIDNGVTFQSSGLFSGLDAGSYSAIVEDDNGCSSSYTFSLTEPVELISSLSDAVDLDCSGDLDGSITVTTGGGETPYYYTLDEVNFQLSPVFNDLGAGDYSVFVSDGNGCRDTVEVTLTEPPVLTSTIFTHIDAQCYGTSSGYLEVLAGGGVPDYEYSIDGSAFQSSPEFYNLAAGSHTIVVRDDHACVATLTETLTQPDLLTFSVDVDDVDCFGDNSGALTVTVSGGTGPYQYSSDGGQSYQPLAVLAGLSTGNYVVSVKDAHNCTVSGGAFISQPAQPLSASLGSVQNVLCRGENTGSAEIEVGGGTEFYQFSIDNGQNFQQSNIIADLIVGAYNVIISDHNGCTDEVSFSISEPAENLRIDLMVVEDIDCNGDDNGLISLIVAGGTPGYQYSVDGGTSYQADNDFTGLDGGIYAVSIRDANGCLITETAEIEEPFAPLVLAFNGSTNVNCENDTTGTLNVSASGGVSPYLYFLDGGDGQLSGIFTGLDAGTYTILVKDLNACISSLELTINAVNYLPEVDFSYQVAGQSVAFINLTTGGQAYNWSFGDGGTSSQTNPNHLYSTPGQYTVTLFAENDCGIDSIVRNISTIIIGVEENEAFSTVIYPNPANDMITLNFTSKEIQDDVVINLHSVDGSLLFSEKVPVQSNSFTRSFTTTSFANGIYMLEIVSGGLRTGKLITINH